MIYIISSDISRICLLAHKVLPAHNLPAVTDWTAASMMTMVGTFVLTKFAKVACRTSETEIGNFYQLIYEGYVLMPMTSEEQRGEPSMDLLEEG